MHHESRAQKTGALQVPVFTCSIACAKRPVLALDQGNLGAFDADPSH